MCLRSPGLFPLEPGVFDAVPEIAGEHKRQPHNQPNPSMMSKDQYLGDPDPTFQPHLMCYAPNTVQSADWRANLALSPIFGSPELMPNGKRAALHIFVIPVDHWSDGTPTTPNPH